jgi:hypothetical protein
MPHRRSRRRMLVLSALIDRVVVWSLDRYEVIWNEEADVVRVAMKGVRV